MDHHGEGVGACDYVVADQWLAFISWSLMTFRISPHLSTAILAGLAVSAFAGNSLLARAALGEGMIGPASFTAIRLASGAAVLLPWLKGAAREPSHWSGALALFVYCGAFSFAYVELGAAGGAMLLFAAVQFTVLAAAARAGNRLRLFEIAGVLLAMAGLTVLLGTSARPGPLLAMASMVVAGVAWGLYSLMGRTARDASGRTARNFVLAALLAAPLPLLDAGVDVSAWGVLLAATSGAITSGLGYVMWYKLVPRLPHVTVGAAQLATPVVAALGAAVLLGEPLTMRFAVASGLIMGGIAATLKRA